MALPSDKITTTLVGQTLGSSSRYVGTLCTHPNINKWSKWKPVRFNTGGNGISLNQLESVKYGLDIEVFDEVGSITSSSTFLWALKNKAINWEYLRPTGGAVSPYRLGDFRNYEHNAIKPIDSMPTYTVYVDNNNNIQIDLDEVVAPPNDYNITLAEIYHNEVPFRDYYLGVMLFQPLNDTYHIGTSNVTIANGGLTIILPNMQNATGAWKSAFFVSSVPFLEGNPTGQGFFIPLELDKIDTVIHESGGLTYIEALSEWNSVYDRINFEIHAVNNENTTVTFTGIQATLVESLHGQQPEEGTTVSTQSIADMMVAGNSVGVKSGLIFNYIRNEARQYWIGVNYTGGTVRYTPVEDYSGMD